MIHRITSTYTKKNIVIFLSLFVIFLCSLVLFLARPSAMRLFFFESLDYKGLFAEKRFLPKRAAQGQVRQFVDDLLLGPMTPRLKPLFPTGTAIRSCFVRKGILYLDLSDKALVYADGKAVTGESVEIFKKNIFKNFNSVKKIYIFIMGTEVYPIM